MKVVIGKKEKYLTDKKKINTSKGIIKVGKRGKVVKSHIGHEFVVAEPNLIDFIEKFKRGAQVILPKDLGIIVAYTGLRPNWKVLDVGTGSGFSSIFIGNLVSKGKVITCEKNEKFYKISKNNLELVGLKNVKMRLGDVKKIKEKDFDLAIVDVKDVKEVVPFVFKKIKIGGWLVVYSPTVEELIKVQKMIKKMEVVEHKIVECIIREWQYEKTLRPKTKGIVHTGFLTFARKFKK